VIDPSQTEIDAMRAAAKFGGEYLGELGRTDLNIISKTEWMVFVDTICTGYVDFISTHPEDVPV
jgi:hypothetical protein